MAIPLILGAAAIQVGSALLGHNAAKKQSRAVRKAALKNLDLIYDDLDAREREERAASLQARERVETEAGALEGQTQVSAAAGNVAGATVDSLVRDVNRQEAQAKLTLDTNLENTQAQIQRQKRGAVVDAENQIATNQAPSGGALALRLAGIGLNAYTQYRGL